MRSDSGDARVNAATAYAHRFGHPREPVPSGPNTLVPVANATSQSALQQLVRLVRHGPTVTAQAVALLAMGLGWPETPETHEHLLWGRRQPRYTVRTAALALTMVSNPQTPIRDLLGADEVAWVLSWIREERYLVERTWTPMTYELVGKAVAEANAEQRAELSDFVLETLRTNGRTGGNRNLCWWLACTALSEDEHFREWIVTELDSDADRPLILYNLDLIPMTWRQHPPMERALATYVRKEIKRDVGSAVQLARNLPRGEARGRLLEALDGFRPWSAAVYLVKDFGDDVEVRSTLLDRLKDDTTAGQFSPVALDVMGIEAGFRRLYSLLKSSNEDDSPIRGEAQVVLAQSVATAWRRIRDSAADRGGPADGKPREDGCGDTSEQARRILTNYGEQDVCSACTNVSTTGLGWQIADIIYTWPSLTVDYAIRALQDDRHVMEGIDDTTHAVVLRAHAPRPCPDSEGLLNAALDLLLFLEPELREVLAYELCSANLAPSLLLEVLSAWKRDSDDGVRRTVVIGITQALIRAQEMASASGAPTQIPEYSAWLVSVREQLCSYGPSMEENRRNAWMAMLLLGDLNLIDGLRETIGEPTEPGVSLHRLGGTADQLLVEFVVANWDTLTAHFGDQLLSRLSAGRRSKSKEEELRAIEAVQALATAADRHPAVARLVRGYLDAANATGAGITTAADAAAHRAQDDLRSDPSVIEWLTRDSESASSIPLLLDASDLAIRSHDRLRIDRVTRWALPRLLDYSGRDFSRSQLHELLGRQLTPNEWDSDEAWRDAHASLRRTVWTLLRPDDRQTQTWLAGLAQWFATGGDPDRQPATWLEVSALCFGATPTIDLPAIIGRLFHPNRAEQLDDSLWMLTMPLLHRLRHDVEAVDALRASLSDAPIAETTAFFSSANSKTPAIDDPSQDVSDAGSGTLDRSAEDFASLARRVYVTALALKHSGHLAPDDLRAVTRILQRADPRLVVLDPFANQAGPLLTAGSVLLQE